MELLVALLAALCSSHYKLSRLLCRSAQLKSQSIIIISRRHSRRSCRTRSTNTMISSVSGRRPYLYMKERVSKDISEVLDHLLSRIRWMQGLTLARFTSYA